MPDKPSKPAPGADGRDPLADISAEDLDALLAQVDSLTAEVEQELGAGEAASGTGGGGAEQAAELARRLEEQVRQIERSADGGAGEARAAFQAVEPAAQDDPRWDAPQTASTAAAGGKRAAPRGAAARYDRLPAESEVASLLKRTPGHRHAGSSDAASRVAESASRWSQLASACWRHGVSRLGWLLKQADRPFANWPAERKAFIGYLALATLFMAVLTCVAAVILHG